MKVKKIMLLLVALRLATLLTGCGVRNDVEVSETFETKDYTFENFDEITIKDIHLKQNNNYFGANVYFCESDTKKISVTASVDVIEEITVKKNMSEIEIHADKFKNYVTRSVDIYIYGYQFSNFNLSTVNVEMDLNAFMNTDIDMNLSGACDVNVKEINNNLDLNLSGASEIYIDKLNANELELESSGASETVVKSLTVNEVNASLSGASKLNLTGNTKKGKYHSSGASDFELKDCINETAEISLSGGSDLFISFSNSLKGSISGGSNVTYYGDANNVDISTSGGAKVNKG